MDFKIYSSIDYNDVLHLMSTVFDSDAITYWTHEVNYTLPDGFDAKDLKWLKDKEFWGSVRKIYFAPLVEGGECIIEDIDDDTHHLNLESVGKGLSIMQKKYPNHWADFVAENHDAITADVFIQCCIFGEIVYG